MKRLFNEDAVKRIAAEVLQEVPKKNDKATILALRGDLGAGKTTLTKAIAKELGITETVVSPTFVIAKFYETTNSDFAQLVHIDAYRIDSTDELQPLGWERILSMPNTLVIVEWPERIEGALPKDRHEYLITHEDGARAIETYEG